ncbi:Stp3p KNAG_0B05940 [Huiozyma naganishii CBS 8797]|uniref:C2H2-type domain-containing protein n=1 Tax=Huiozyma naganishii (strain ATCC MYA-139 / BCRC 22969 / CBS 8797 / KCTC 17520 / NBRC 10181 / NCYC 3082 / Yp74L-3) TaxID=1071383 RepID=J7S423_HUIN7|nr:hypothetical protein KNAG_0B05940 [Kazachstania naganishii CBS 8797]CCK69024.1 hypothetical protein KNAG_0B05940 [Kazachstania naganishii CBS 8797]
MGDRSLSPQSVSSENVDTGRMLKASSSNNSAVSLDKYHEPSTLEKLQQLTELNIRRLNGTPVTAGSSMGNAASVASNNFSLPPISSFDNLVRAAERQYNDNGTLVIGDGAPRGRTQRPASVTNSSNSSRGSNTSDAAGRGGAALGSSPLDSEAQSPISPAGSGTAVRDTTATTTTTTGSSSSSKVTKPRRKKQCPICFNYYANLSTHKSTHLTPEDRPHRCPVCQRGFARNNDLIRHKKRHWKDVDQPIGDDTDPVSGEKFPEQATEHDKLIALHRIKGTFKCPFNSTLIQLDMEMYPFKSRPLLFETSNCHSTGVFSRCDTFKNHLKALHFEYPPGTKKKERTVVPGRCRNCGVKFPNVDTWLTEHVGKQCGYTYH